MQAKKHSYIQNTSSSSTFMWTRDYPGFPGVSREKFSRMRMTQDSCLCFTLRFVKFLSSCLFSLPHQLIPNCPAHHWQNSFPCLPIRPCLFIAHSLPMAPRCHGYHMSWIFQNIFISNILSCGQTMCQIICQKICPDLGFENMVALPIASQIWLLSVLPYLAN